MNKELEEITTIAIPKELVARIRDHGKMGTKHWEVIDKMEQFYRSNHPIKERAKLTPDEIDKRKAKIAEGKQIVDEMIVESSPTIKEAPVTPAEQLRKDTGTVNQIIGIEQDNTDCPELMKMSANTKADLIKRIGVDSYAKIEKKIIDKQTEDTEFM